MGHICANFFLRTKREKGNILTMKNEVENRCSHCSVLPLLYRELFCREVNECTRREREKIIKCL